MKFVKYIISVLISVCILSGTVVFIFSEKKDFSENENRSLADPPEFSTENIADGNFMMETEEYLKDHFPARDLLMKFKTKAQLLAGYRKIGDVFIGKERLYQVVASPDISRLTVSANRLFSAIESSSLKTSVMLIPTAAEIYPEDLPPYAQVIDESEIIDDILSEIDCDIKINMSDVLKEEKSKENNLFYYTDHHWTTYAAKSAYDKFCEEKNFAVISDDEFDKTCISDEFRGTLYSKILDDSLKDEICRYDYKDMTFSCKSGNVLTGEFKAFEYYAKEYLSKKDKYAYFGGGNLPLLILENENCTQDSEIVVVKDSFANCFIPFLSINYKRIHVIDPRYFKGRTISSYINENKNITDVIIIYGINSLNDNTAVSALS